MKEIHLGPILTENRRKVGITQEDLARFLGVSKAAVSKWETGSAYPDILMLPRLASFFNITIDQLMGYRPQLTPEEIRQIYMDLAKEFTVLPFGKALEHCREYIREYSSCYPLLFQMGTLFINHISLSPSSDETRDLIKEALELFRKVKAYEKEPDLINGSTQMEAYCLLLLDRPEEVLDLLSEDLTIAGPLEPLVASAWKMKGNLTEAKRVLQIGIYRDMLSLIHQLLPYISLCPEDPVALEESCCRLQKLSEIFCLDKLHPGTLLSCYITMAQSMLQSGKKKEALEMLDAYTRLASGNIYPLKLHGDEYFHLLDDWFEKAFIMGDYPPRNERTIRRSVTQALAENPFFFSLKEDPRFQKMVHKLKEKEEEM